MWTIYAAVGICALATFAVAVAFWTQAEIQEHHRQLVRAAKEEAKKAATRN